MEKIKSKLVAGIAILGVILILGGLKTGFLLLSLIGIIVLIPFALYYLYLRRVESVSTKSAAKELVEFKANALKVEAIIESFEVGSNAWTETIDNNSRYAWMNTAVGYSQNNIKAVDHVQTAVKLKIKYQDQSEEYVLMCHKQPETITMFLEMHKQTSIYIDKNNPEKKYLDLEFLQNY